MPTRRLVLAAPMLAAPMLALAGRARAATWPEDRPVEIIIPYPPSGGVDTMARVVLNHVAPRIPGLQGDAELRAHGASASPRAIWSASSRVVASGFST